MDLVSLRYFYDCAMLGSMTAAAAKHRVSRPAISIAVRRLESQLNTELLVHQRRGFELTEKGKQLCASASEIFEVVKNVTATISNPKNETLSGVARLGIARVLSTFRFDDTLVEMSKDYPALKFKLMLNQSEEILDMLAARDLDAALIISDEHRQGINSQILRDGHFVLVKPRSMEASAARYAMSERRPEVHAAQRAFKERFSRELPVFAEIPSWDTIWNWVQRGHCGGLIPDLFLRRRGYRDPDVTKIMDNIHPYTIRLFYNDSKHQNPLIRTLITRLKTAFKK
jgi:DNA-binding transcriptional LysR family regulator